MMLHSKIIAAGLGASIALAGVVPASAMPSVGSSKVTQSAPQGSLVNVRRGRNGALAAGAAIAGVGILAGAAIANSNRYGYAEPYYYDGPVYASPPPAYYVPAPVYAAPPAYYYEPPAYYAPRRGYYTTGREHNYR